jgi:hypothetical protein
MEQLIGVKACRFAYKLVHLIDCWHTGIAVDNWFQETTVFGSAGKF